MKNELPSLESICDHFREELEDLHWEIQDLSAKEGTQERIMVLEERHFRIQALLRSLGC